MLCYIVVYELYSTLLYYIQTAMLNFALWYSIVCSCKQVTKAEERPSLDEVRLLGLPTTCVAPTEFRGGRFSVNVTLDFGVIWPSAMRSVGRKGKNGWLDVPPRLFRYPLGDKAHTVEG